MKTSRSMLTWTLICLSSAFTCGVIGCVTDTLLSDINDWDLTACGDAPFVCVELFSDNSDKFQGDSNVAVGNWIIDW